MFDQPTITAASVDANFGAALDWLIEWVAICDQSAEAHYRHMIDGRHRTCGCKWEGNDECR